MVAPLVTTTSMLHPGSALVTAPKRWGPVTPTIDGGSSLDAATGMAAGVDPSWPVSVAANGPMSPLRSRVTVTVCHENGGIVPIAGAIERFGEEEPRENRTGVPPPFCRFRYCVF